MTHVFNNVRQKVTNSLGSAFTKEDVMGILAEVEGHLKAEEHLNGEKPGMLSDAAIKELSARLSSGVANYVNNLNTDEIVNLDTAEFSLSGNEIELDSVDIYYKFPDHLADAVQEDITEFFEQLKERAEMEAKLGSE